MTTSATRSLFAQFQRMLTAAGGEAYYVEQLVQAADIIATHPALARGSIVVPPVPPSRENRNGAIPLWLALLPALRERGISIVEAGTPPEVADAPAGLSGAELAVAETGSVLIAENGLSARVVTMLTLTHFVVLDAADIVAMLDDAGQRLQQLARPGPEQRHYMTFVTGPSRTADIERTLTIGVQGPKALCVIFIANWKEQA